MTTPTQPHVDAVVVGAGFAGLRTIHELRELGLTMQAFEAGSDVGGTWYWNRYPGARTDTESWAYCFSFDKELCQEWDWPERFPAQPDVLAYLRRVADKHDMRKEIKFSTRVVAASFDETVNLWTVETDDGAETVCRWLITGLGWLGVSYKPQFPGLDSFQGEWYQTSLWPREPVDLEGKRIAVIGTGATGIQVTTAVAPTAEHLTVFQRTPNYALPARNFALADAQRSEIKRNYDAIWEQVQRQAFAFPMDAANRVGSDVDDDAMQKILERGWETGGFRYLFETFDDMFADPRVNDAASEFVRHKIRTIVKDPSTAELLCPTTHPIGGKRPPLANFYYETFNRPNVSLVSVRDNPIADVTPQGIRLEDGSEYGCDVIIFATGFDAITGPLERMNIRGVGNRKLADEWSNAPKLHLGLSTPGFPNLFSILGPQGPFVQHPPLIETQAQFIGKVLSQAIEKGADRVEATHEAARTWSDLCDLVLSMTVIPKGIDDRPWFLGANIPGKQPSTLCYLGGMAGYCAELDKDIDSGFGGWSMSSVAVPA